MKREKKDNKGKSPVGLISSDFILGMGDALNFGKFKYGAHNWREGIPTDELFDAAQRHLLKWNKGIDLDDESNLNHLLHAAVDIMMIYEQMMYKPELDTRFKRDYGKANRKKNSKRKD